MSISLVAVFIPILLMGGIVGRLFREFAVTLSVAILISLVVSLTTTPMMCAAPAPAPRARSATAGSTRPASGSSTGSCGRYETSPRAGCCGTSRFMLVRDPRDHGAQRLPVRDHPQGLLPAAGHRPAHRLHPGRPGHLVPGHAGEARRSSWTSCRHDPAVENVIGFTGGGGGDHQHRPDVRRAEAAATSARPTADQVIARLRGKLAQVPGATLFLQPVQDIRVGGRPQQRAVPVHAAGRRPRRAATTGRPGCSRRCARCPSWPTSTATSRTRACRPRWSSTAPPPRGSGVTPQVIDDTLYDAFGQRQVSTIYTR